MVSLYSTQYKSLQRNQKIEYTHDQLPVSEWSTLHSSTRTTTVYFSWTNLSYMQNTVK